MPTPAVTPDVRRPIAEPPAEGAAGYFDLAAFNAAPLRREPYDWLLVPGFVRPDALAVINADYPPITEPTAFMAEELECGPTFAAMVKHLRSDDFARRISAKFGVDVTNLPRRTVSVRRFADPSDGNIHTDSQPKVITLLVYFNAEWSQPGGRLRVLRSGTDVNDYAAEITPTGGTLFAFRRAENSWHGFPSCTGERRSLQMHYAWPQPAEREHVRKPSLKKRLKHLLAGFG